MGRQAIRSRSDVAIGFWHGRHAHAILLLPFKEGDCLLKLGNLSLQGRNIPRYWAVSLRVLRVWAVISRFARRRICSFETLVMLGI